MSEIPPFCVYVNGCPGFYNVEICKELSALISGSRVLNLGIIPKHFNPDPLFNTCPLFVEEHAQWYLRLLLAGAASDSDQAKQHSWIFADFRGSTGINNNDLSVEEYEYAARQLDLPFIHVILHCNSQKQNNSFSLFGQSVPYSNAFDFEVFESVWRNEDIRASGKANELEMDIADLEPAKLAEKIFKGISEILHF